MNNIPEKLKEEMNFHHQQLTQIASKYKDNSGGGLEGNIFTYNGTDTAPFMWHKIHNIYNLAQSCKENVLEIGFNCGNSALVFLMANSNIKFYAVDICIHEYVQDCVDYLNKHFNNRITLLKGSSLDVLPKINKNIGNSIGIFHIDGWHVEEGIDADMRNCYNLAQDKAYVIVDDCNNECIEKKYIKYITDGKIIDRPECVIFPTPYWPHKIGQFRKV